MSGAEIWGVRFTDCLWMASLVEVNYQQSVFGVRIDPVGIHVVTRHRPFVFLRHPLEWQIIDLALQAYGKVGVSLYDTLGKDSVGKDPTCAKADVFADVLGTQNSCNYILNLFFHS